MVNRFSLRSQPQKTGYAFRPRSCKVQAEKRSSTQRAPITAKSLAMKGTTAFVPPRLRVSIKREDIPETTVSGSDSASTSSRETTPIRRVAISRRRASSPSFANSQHQPCVFPGCNKQNRKRHLATHPEWLEEQWENGGMDAFFATLNANTSLLCDDPSHHHTPRSNISHFWMHIKNNDCTPVHPILAFANIIRLASSNPQRAHISETCVGIHLASREVSLDEFAPHWRVPGEEYRVGGSHYGSADELLAKLWAPPTVASNGAGNTRSASLLPFSSRPARIALSLGSDDGDRARTRQRKSDPGPSAHHITHRYEEEVVEEEEQHTRCDLRPGTPYASNWSTSDDDPSDVSSLSDCSTPYNLVPPTQHIHIRGLPQFRPAFEQALLNGHLRPALCPYYGWRFESEYPTMERVPIWADWSELERARHHNMGGAGEQSYGSTIVDPNIDPRLYVLQAI